MAEPSPEYLKRISRLFCERYNGINNTNFIFDEFEKKPCEVDFYIRDGAARIPVQYSILQSTPYFLKSAAQTAIVTQKLEEKANIYGFKCTISVVFNKVPVDEEDIDKFVGRFMIFLRQHLSGNSFRLRFKRNDDLGLLNGIFEYLAEFEIKSVRDSQFGLIIGNEAWGYTRTVDEDVDHLLKQICEKDAKYYPNNELILLLATDPMPITGVSLNELRKKCNVLKFNCKEVWQVSLGDEGFCDKLYPFDLTD